MKNNLLKNSLTVVCIAFTTVISLQAEDSMKPYGTQHEKMEMMDGAMMMDGKMMECKGGKHMDMKKDMEMTDGTKVMTNGKVMMKNGKSMMLKDGDMVSMDGKVMEKAMMHEKK